MTRKILIAFSAITILTAATIFASAQGTDFLYQGALKNGAVAANGNFDFEFALFTAVSGGTQAGSTITAANVAVTDGTLSVPLNFGSQFPGASRFLEIRVRPSGGGAFTILTPRQQLRSSPYSVQSLNAAQLGGVAASEFIQSGATGVNAGSQFEIGGSRVFSIGGTSNTFAGVGTGQANTTGGENSFFGNGAGQANNSGNQNSFFGLSAGRANTTGSTNSFFGATSGDANTTGSENSFFGAASGGSNVSGNQNSVFGRLAGQLGQLGNENSIFGYSAGKRVASNFNAMFGSQAGAATTTGFANSFFGYSSGLVNLDGQNNSFFGVNSGLGNTSGSFNTFVGRRSGQANTTGGFNTFVGTNAGNTNISGGNNTAIGADSDVSGTGLSFATAIGSGAIVSTSNTIVIGRNLETVKIPGDLNVSGNVFSTQIGQFTSLSDAGDVHACVANSSFPGYKYVGQCVSSIRYKENVAPLMSGISIIRRLHPVTYNWKSNGIAAIGLIAEEVFKVEPLLTSQDEKGVTQSIKYDSISVVLVNAVKEQQAQIEAQAKQIERQHYEINALKALVCRRNTKAAICRGAR